MTYANAVGLKTQANIHIAMQTRQKNSDEVLGAQLL